MFNIKDYATLRKTGFSIKYHGTITDIDGASYSFDSSNIVQNSGKITRSCTNSSAIAIGSVESSYFAVSIKNDSINRYKLYNTKKSGTISLFGTVLQKNGYLLTESGDYILTESGERILWDNDTEIPFGVYNITEALRKKDVLNITAFDNMTLFGKNVDDTDDGLKEVQTPFAWLVWLCLCCGIKLGNTDTEVATFANGTKLLMFDSTHSDDIKTYRDILSHLAIATGTVAVIGRDGKLYLKSFSRTPYIAEYGAGDRYDSDVADFVTRYSGIYFTYATDTDSTDEYFHTSDDNYLAFTVGVNAFLQISDTTERAIACQNVMNALANAVYVPFSMTCLGDPCIDVMDVIHVKDNQMTDYDIAVVTHMTYSLNGKATLKCAGKNPIMDASETKAEKVIKSLSDKTQQAISRSELLSSIAESAKSITGNKGGYYRVWNNSTKLPDAPNETLWMMDTDDPYLSNNLFVINAGGFGHTTDYDDPSAYNIAITPDGKINASMILTGILKANVIQTGLIRDYVYVDAKLQDPKTTWNLDTGEFKTESLTKAQGDILSITAGVDVSIINLKTLNSNQTEISSNLENIRDNAGPFYMISESGSYILTEDGKMIDIGGGDLRHAIEEVRDISSSLIQQTADNITLAVKQGYETITGAESHYESYESRITQNASDITLSVSKVRENFASSSSEITINSGKINFATAGVLTISAGNFTLDESGNMTAKGNAEFTGKVTAQSGTIGGWTINSGSLSGSGKISGGTISSPTIIFANNVTASGNSYSSGTSGVLFKGGTNSDFSVSTTTIGINAEGGVLQLRSATSVELYSKTVFLGSTTDYTSGLLKLYQNGTNLGVQILASDNYGRMIQARNGYNHGFGYPIISANFDHVYTCHWNGSSLHFYVDVADVGSISDRRLKKDIDALSDDYINAVSKVEFKQFRYNRDESLFDNSVLRFGVVAQDVIKQFVDAGINPLHTNLIHEHTEKFGDTTKYYSVDYETFLIARLAGVEKRLAKLEGTA